MIGLIQFLRQWRCFHHFSKKHDRNIETGEQFVQKCTKCGKERERMNREYIVQ